MLKEPGGPGTNNEYNTMRDAAFSDQNKQQNKQR
jgi:hypothetical protein